MRVEHRPRRVDRPPHPSRSRIRLRHRGRGPNSRSTEMGAVKMKPGDALPGADRHDRSGGRTARRGPSSSPPTWSKRASRWLRPHDEIGRMNDVHRIDSRLQRRAGGITGTARAASCWAANQDRHDALLRPISERLIALADARPANSCSTSAAAAARPRSSSRSASRPRARRSASTSPTPLVRRARERAPEDAPARFVHADATVYEAPPGEIDLVASRFGVMFFADPAQSFANLRAGMRPGGRLAFACWRAARDNPWAVVPLRAAARARPAAARNRTRGSRPVRLRRRAPGAPAARRRRLCRHRGDPENFDLDVGVGEGLESAVEIA